MENSIQNLPCGMSEMIPKSPKNPRPYRAKVSLVHPSRLRSPFASTVTPLAIRGFYTQPHALGRSYSQPYALGHSYSQPLEGPPHPPPYWDPPNMTRKVSLSFEVPYGKNIV